MKKFFEMKYNGQPYDAVGRRKGQELFYILGGNKVAPGGASAGPTALNKAPTKISTGGPKVSTGAAAPLKTQGTAVSKASIGGTASKAGKIGGEGDASKLQ